LAQRYELGPHRSQGLVDVLDRILDKGLMIAGDIRIQLADVELLTIQIRLLVCSLDKAEEMGINWWKTDPRLSTYAQGASELGPEAGRPVTKIAGARAPAVEEGLNSSPGEGRKWP
jgi:hypothetical protein